MFRLLGRRTLKVAAAVMLAAVGCGSILASAR
jgi:hypothetical protein